MPGKARGLDSIRQVAPEARAATPRTRFIRGEHQSPDALCATPCDHGEPFAAVFAPGISLMSEPFEEVWICRALNPYFFVERVRVDLQLLFAVRAQTNDATEAQVTFNPGQQSEDLGLALCELFEQLCGDQAARRKDAKAFAFRLKSHPVCLQVDE
jgi:hypothetical protein